MVINVATLSHLQALSEGGQKSLLESSSEPLPPLLTDKMLIIGSRFTVF